MVHQEHPDISCRLPPHVHRSTSVCTCQACIRRTVRSLDLPCMISAANYQRITTGRCQSVPLNQQTVYVNDNQTQSCTTNTRQAALTHRLLTLYWNHATNADEKRDVKCIKEISNKTTLATDNKATISSKYQLTKERLYRLIGSTLEHKIHRFWGYSPIFIVSE